MLGGGADGDGRGRARTAHAWNPALASTVHLPLLPPPTPRRCASVEQPAGCGAVCSTQRSGEGGDGSPAGPLITGDFGRRLVLIRDGAAGCLEELGCESGHGQRSQGSFGCLISIWRHAQVCCVGGAGPAMSPKMGRYYGAHTGLETGLETAGIGHCWWGYGRRIVGRTHPPAWCVVRVSLCLRSCARAEVSSHPICPCRSAAVLFKAIDTVRHTTHPIAAPPTCTNKLQAQAASVCCLGLPFPTPRYARNPTHQKNTGT